MSFASSLSLPANPSYMESTTLRLLKRSCGEFFTICKHAHDTLQVPT